jgi:hypothetical protein
VTAKNPVGRKPEGRGLLKIACNALIKSIPSAKNKLGKSKNKRSEVFRGSLHNQRRLAHVSHRK